MKKRISDFYMRPSHKTNHILEQDKCKEEEGGEGTLAYVASESLIRGQKVVK